MHKANLINFGILPWYSRRLRNLVRSSKATGSGSSTFANVLKWEVVEVENVTGQQSLEALHGLNQREIEILLAGGLLNYARQMR
jgi:aconitate hydratase